MQESLNCLMILLIFSKRCISSCFFASWWEITRKVDLSNSTTSSAFKVLQNYSKFFSRVFTLGRRKYTIWDQALYKVSSQMEVLKQSTSKPLVFSIIFIRFSWNIFSLIGSAKRSNLWTRQKIFALWERSVKALRQFS